MLRKYAVIVAGGAGSRMESTTPKQFLQLAGCPVLMHTLGVFNATDPHIEIILVLPRGFIALWEELCQKHAFHVKHMVVEGGQTRFRSVKNGLEHTEAEGLVAIHDGVRPFVAPEVIMESYRTAALRGSAVASIPLIESIREMSGPGTSSARDRAKFRTVQTPQTFRCELIRNAYLQQESELFTDDAGVAESAGVGIVLIAGNKENIKITHPFDLIFAEAYLVKKKGTT